MNAVNKPNTTVGRRCSECNNFAFFVESTINEDTVLMCPICAVKDRTGREIMVGRIETPLDEIKSEMDERTKTGITTGDEKMIMWLIMELERLNAIISIHPNNWKS